MSDNATAAAQDTTKAGDNQSGQTVLTGEVKPAESVKPDDARTTETPKAEKPVVPEKYDLKLPEGSLLDASRIEKIEAYAKAHGFSNEQAQAFLEEQHSLLADHIESQREAFRQKSETWVKELQADKEFGGEAFSQNAELAKRFINRFGSETLKDALDQTGLGNHPELFRMIVRASKAMSEDQLIIPGSQSGGKTRLSKAEKLYGGTKA